MLKLNDQQIEIAEYLKEINVNYSVRYASNNEHDEEWPCDLWRASFNDKTFDFKTGLGHRKTVSVGIKNAYKKYFDLIGGFSGEVFRVISESNPTKRLAAFAPQAADVLYCLLLDMQAHESSLDDWCNDFGYDSDSIKAKTIYDACNSIYFDMMAIFTNEQIEALNELLQDY